MLEVSIFIIEINALIEEIMEHYVGRLEDFKGVTVVPVWGVPQSEQCRNCVFFDSCKANEDVSNFVTDGDQKCIDHNGKFKIEFREVK